MGVRIVERSGLAAVDHDKHPSWLHFDGADADAVQLGIGHPGDEAELPDPAGGVAGQAAVVRGDVVDGQDGQAVAFADSLELAEQPFPIGCLDLLVAPGTGIPALKQGFGGDHEDLVADPGDDLETTVQDQFDSRIAGMQGLDDPDQAGLLRGFVELPGQPVGVEGVEKKAAITLFPERSDDTVGEEGRPVGRRLVNDDRVPVAVARQFPWFGDIPEIRARRLHFGHGNIGEKLAVARGLPLRVMAVTGFDDDDVENAEFLERNRMAVIERNRRRCLGNSACGP